MLDEHTSSNIPYSGITYTPNYEVYDPRPCWQNTSKIEQAFNIVQKLMEDKTIKVETVNDFIKLVYKIAGII